MESHAHTHRGVGLRSMRTVHLNNLIGRKEGSVYGESAGRREPLEELMEVLF